MKSTVSGQVWALQCCKLLFGDKGEGTWIVGLLRDEILDSRVGGFAIRRYDGWLLEVGLQMPSQSDC